MKKIALIISLMALFSLNVNAQRKTTAFGLKLGPNLGWASAGSTTTSSDGVGVGFAFGGIVDHYFSKHIAASSGLNLNFLSMGYQFEDSRIPENYLEATKVSVNRRFKGTYLEVPIKLKVKIDIIDSWKAYAEGGVGLGFNLRAMGKDSYKDSFGTLYEDKSFSNYRDQYKIIQTALNFGLGAIFEVNSKFSLFAQLTFNHALSNSFNKAMEKQTGSIIRTNFIGLEIGIIN